MREVRRYPNRRMYDTRERCYVALDEIGRWIREGQRVRVLDVKTNEDVTIAALLPLLLERLATDLRGAAGAETLHAWLREGIHSSTANEGELIADTTMKLAPTSIEARLDGIEARLRELELRR